MKKIKEILNEQLETYREWKRREALPDDDDDHIDSSFCYDCALELFGDRGVCFELMEELVKDDKK